MFYSSKTDSFIIENFFTTVIEPTYFSELPSVRRGRQEVDLHRVRQQVPPEGLRARTRRLQAHRGRKRSRRSGN